jgi:hypothetical protein
MVAAGVAPSAVSACRGNTILNLVSAEEKEGGNEAPFAYDLETP